MSLTENLQKPYIEGIVYELEKIIGTKEFVKNLKSSIVAGLVLDSDTKMQDIRKTHLITANSDKNKIFTYLKNLYATGNYEVFEHCFVNLKLADCYNDRNLVFAIRDFLRYLPEFNEEAETEVSEYVYYNIPNMVDAKKYPEHFQRWQMIRGTLFSHLLFNVSHFDIKYNPLTSGIFINLKVFLELLRELNRDFDFWNYTEANLETINDLDIETIQPQEGEWELYMIHSYIDPIPTVQFVLNNVSLFTLMELRKLNTISVTSRNFDYFNYSFEDLDKKFSFPDTSYLRENSNSIKETFEISNETQFNIYSTLIKNGLKKKDAVYALPMGFKTTCMVTASGFGLSQLLEYKNNDKIGFELKNVCSLLDDYINIQRTV